MKKRWTAVVCAAVLAVAALPAAVSAKEKDEGELTRVTLNEVAHSIFYAPQYVAIEEGYFREEGLDLELVTGFGADKVMGSGYRFYGGGSVGLRIFGGRQ